MAAKDFSHQKTLQVREIGEFNMVNYTKSLQGAAKKVQEQNKLEDPDSESTRIKSKKPLN